MEPYAPTQPAPPTRGLFALGGLIATVLVAATIAAFTVEPGGGGGDPVPVETLGSAAETLETVATSRLRMTFRGEGNGTEIVLEGDGVIDNERRLGAFALELPCGVVRFVSSGTDFYVRGPTSPGWIKVDASAVPIAGGTVPGAPMDPQQMLDSLRGVGEVRRIGDEQVDGVATTHYRASGSLGDVLPEDDPTMQALQAQDIEAAVTFDVWIDDGGLARRVATTSEAQGFAFTFTFELHAFGEPVEVEVPAAGDLVAERSVASMLELSQIGGQVGAECAGGAPAAG